MTFEKSVHNVLWGSESWEISAHTSDPSVIEDGEEKGRRLNGIYPNFPLLFKVIDAKTRISVQVHPNEETCKVTGGEVARNAACHGQNIKDLAGSNPAGGLAPEFLAAVNRQFADDEVLGGSAGEPDVVEDVGLDLGGDAAAENQNELRVLFELCVPGGLELARKPFVVLSHPGYFIEKNDRLSGIERLVKTLKRLEPVLRRLVPRLVALRGKLLAERHELVGVGHAGTRRFSCNLYESDFGSRGKLFDQGGFSNASASSARHQRCRVLSPSCSDDGGMS